MNQNAVARPVRELEFDRSRAVRHVRAPMSEPQPVIRIAKSAAYAAIALQVTQLLFFEYLPDNVRLTLATMAFILSFSVAAVMSAIGRERYVGFWLIGLSMMISWLFSYAVGGYTSDLATMAQNISMITWPILAFSLADKLSPKVVVAVFVLPIVMGAIIAGTASSIVFAGTERFATFAGGPHASGYAVAGSILALWSLRKRYRKQAYALAAVIMIGIILAWGYQSRTSWAMIIVAATLSTMTLILRRGGPLALLSVVAIGLFGAALTAIALSDADFNEISSGRLANYAERINMLMRAGIDSIIFGQGAGSDLILTDQWWWSAKVSHNDLLTAMNERGVVGALGFILYFFLLYRKACGDARWIVGALFMAAVLSGVFTRPLIVTLFALAIAISSLQIYDSRLVTAGRRRPRRPSRPAMR